jgi:hypothetical protein
MSIPMGITCLVIPNGVAADPVMDVKQWSTRKHVRAATMPFSIARHAVMTTSIGNRTRMKMTITLHMFVYSVLIARTIQSSSAWLRAVRM